MANKKEYPIVFTPRGLSDAWDSTETFPGACRYLTNLIFSQKDPELVLARPGVGGGIVNLSDPNGLIWGSFKWGAGGLWSSGFLGATFISIQIAIGNLVYGMVSCTIYGGYDVPFCYDLNANQFIPISGPNAGNLPVSPATSGDWIPPTMAVIGAEIVITHPGYSGLPQTGFLTSSISGSALTVTSVVGTIVIGSNITGAGVPANTVVNGFIVGSGTFGGPGIYTLNNTVSSPIASESMTATSANFFGVINIANTASPYYYATNTGIFPLPSVPNAVTNFNNRAYFACSNNAYFSDVLFPTQMTNAGQALTVGDPTPIIGFCGLPIETTSSGVVGALIVFKAFQIWQITGDAAITNSLAQNYLSLNIGTTSPRSIVQTPVGTIFASIDGPYYVSAFGQILPLTKDGNKLVQDVQRPFQYIINPSRAAAGFTGSVYRICMNTVIDGNQGSYDYWFDVTSRRWNGPHTFQYDCVSQAGNYFIISGSANGASLWKSEYFQNSDSVYNDNGVALSVFMQTAMLPKTQNINEKQVVESTIELSTAAATQSYTVNAIDDHYQTMGTATISITNPLPTWGNFNWGDGSLWSNSNIQPYTYQIPWAAPLVFKKLAYQVSATANYNLAIGTAFSKYRDTGYTNVILPWNYAAPTPAPVMPQPPTGLTAFAGNTSTTENWNNVFNATTYNLYWSLTPGAGITGTKISGISGMTYNHTGLNNGVTYYYVVTAVNSAGESGPSNQASATPNFATMYGGANNGSGTAIYLFSRNSNGQLSALSPALFQITGNPGIQSNGRSILVSPNGANLYLATNNGIYQYSRNPNTGAITPLSPANVIATNVVLGLAINPSGTSLYCGNVHTSAIDKFSISSTGALTLASSFVDGITGEVLMHPSGNYVYHTSGGQIYQYDSNLNPLSPAFISTPHGSTEMAISPNGNYLYSIIPGGSFSISQFSVGSNGVLGALSPATLTMSENNPYSLTVSPDNNNLYVTNITPPSGNAGVHQFSIGSNGQLSYLSTPYVSFANASTGPILISQDGLFAYVANGAGNTQMMQFSRATNGLLTPLSPASIGVAAAAFTSLAIFD